MVVQSKNVSLKDKVLLYSKFYFENQMSYMKRYARKSIFHGWTENICHSASLFDKPRDVDQ